jgi:hypothetical protein
LLRVPMHHWHFFSYANKIVMGRQHYDRPRDK